MKFTKYLVAVLVIGGFFAASTAQDMGGKVALHFEIKPKAGMHMQFETALKAHVQWRKEHKDPWQWFVAQVVTGKSYGDYIVRSDEMDWAAMDTYAFRDKGAAHFMTTVGPFMESINSSITATNEAVSDWPDDLIPTIIKVETFSLKPGKAQQFWTTVAKAHKAFKGRMGAYDWAVVAVGEGMGSTASLVLPMKSWAEMKPRTQEMMGYFKEAFGADGAAKLMGHFEDAISGVDSIVVAVRPDLSLIRF